MGGGLAIEESPVDMESGLNQLETTQSFMQEQAGAVGFAGQVDQEREQSHRKLSPLVIAVIALALLAGITLVAVLILQQGNQGKEPPAQVQAQDGQAASEVANAPEETYHHEAGIITVDFPIDWAPPAVQWSSRGHTSGITTHEGTFSDSITTSVARFDGLITEGMTADGNTVWKRDEGGNLLAWSITSKDITMTLGVTNAALVVWNAAHGESSDLSADEQAQYLHLLAGDRLTVQEVVGLSQAEAEELGEREINAYMEEKVLPRITLGKQEDNPASSSSSTSSTDEHAAARDAAIAAGKQVLTGSIMSTTDDEAWVMSTGRNPNAGPYYTNRAVTILFLDQKTSIEGADPTSAGGYKTLREQDVIELPESFASYDGQRVEMAFTKDDLIMPSDVSHIKGTGEVIATGEAAGSGGVQAASSGDFVLADSSTKRYTRGELEALDNHELFLARNEIFARYGCGFNTPELRERFESMSWYHETIPAGSYGTDILNAVEKDNVELMKAIEQERNSPYL